MKKNSLCKPHTFSRGQSIFASSLNENFDRLYEESNAQNARPDVVERSVYSNANTPAGGIIIYSGSWDFNSRGLGMGKLTGWAQGKSSFDNMPRSSNKIET